MKFARLLAVASALALAACATGPDYAPQRSWPRRWSFHRSRTSALVSTLARGSLCGGCLMTRCSTGWSATRSPPTTDIRVAVAHLAKGPRAAPRGTRRPRAAGRPRRQRPIMAAPRPRPVRGATQPRSRSAPKPASPTKSTCSDASAAASKPRAAIARRHSWTRTRVRVAVVADTVRAYVDAASSAERIGVAEKIVALLDRSLALTERRGSRSASSPASTPRALRASRQRRAENSRAPGAAAERPVPPCHADRSSTARLARQRGVAHLDLALDQPIPVGDGVGLLARRPDVRAAERRLAAATARIGVATADLYPHIALGASIGSSASGLGNILSTACLARWPADQLDRQSHGGAGEGRGVQGRRAGRAGDLRRHCPRRPWRGRNCSVQLSPGGPSPRRAARLP